MDVSLEQSAHSAEELKERPSETSKLFAPFPSLNNSRILTLKAISEKFQSKKVGPKKEENLMRRAEAELMRFGHCQLFEYFVESLDAFWKYPGVMSGIIGLFGVVTWGASDIILQK
jgi:hypothetical protein